MFSFPHLGRPHFWAALPLLALLGLSLSIPCVVQAQGGYPGGGGSYGGPDYTGGTVVTTSQGVTNGTTNYSPTSSGYGGSYYASGSSDANGANITTGTATCSGKITSTFTWNNGGDPSSTPPKCIIVTEHCVASWSGEASGGATVTGTCTNPLGGSSVPASPGPGATWDYTRYTVQSDPPATLVISCSPEADATSTGSSTPSSNAVGGASVSYSVSVSPVTISLSGATLANGLQEALTGQQITASLNTSFSVDPNSYSWSASGSLFKNYDWTLSSNQLTGMTDADYFRSYFAFYDAAAGTIPLTCSATVVCPDGTRLSVNAQQPITILKPMETAWAISATNTPNGPFYYDYDSNGNYNPQYGVQTTWNPITVTIPSPFTGGQVCLAQIANFNRVATRVAVNGASNTYVVTPAAQGLDTGFPYRIAYQVDAQGHIVTGNDGLYASLSPPQWSVTGSGPSSGAGGDSPVNVCEPSLVSGDTGGPDWRSSTDTDQFDTWTMYRPPAVGGQPTVWVPLQTIHWAWSGSANVHTDANGNVIPHQDGTGNAQWYYTVPPVNPAGNPANTTAFPTWISVIPYGLTMGPPAAH